MKPPREGPWSRAAAPRLRPWLCAPAPPLHTAPAVPASPPLPQVDACADPEVVRAVAARRTGTVCVSALTGEGLAELLERVGSKLQDAMVSVHVLVPYAQARPSRCY